MPSHPPKLLKTKAKHSFCLSTFLSTYLFFFLHAVFLNWWEIRFVFWGDSAGRFFLIFNLHHELICLIKSEEIFILRYRSSHPEVFLGKGVLKICSKFTGEHPSPSVNSIKLLCNFIEITLWLRCSPVNLLHIFRTPFPKNTSGWSLLEIYPSDLEPFWDIPWDIPWSHISYHSSVFKYGLTTLSKFYPIKNDFSAEP